MKNKLKWGKKPQEKPVDKNVSRFNLEINTETGAINLSPVGNVTVSNQGLLSAIQTLATQMIYEAGRRDGFEEAIKKVSSGNNS